eukprot:TRINITY_DN2753_c0_g1_i1.p1 TRINITY_DN2753_c0_g1~~TRINITY_DN2753_c0_g1_i1.p1  ORF type:complete len:199 (-),score=26.17 TRINITY_DN2753_c0_g1_i1:36-581(-)
MVSRSGKNILRRTLRKGLYEGNSYLEAQDNIIKWMNALTSSDEQDSFPTKTTITTTSIKISSSTNTFWGGLYGAMVLRFGGQSVRSFDCETSNTTKFLHGLYFKQEHGDYILKNLFLKQFTAFASYKDENVREDNLYQFTFTTAEIGIRERVKQFDTIDNALGNRIKRNAKKKKVPTATLR